MNVTAHFFCFVNHIVLTIMEIFGKIQSFRNQIISIYQHFSKDSTALLNAASSKFKRFSNLTVFEVLMMSIEMWTQCRCRKLNESLPDFLFKDRIVFRFFVQTQRKQTPRPVRMKNPTYPNEPTSEHTHNVPHRKRDNYRWDQCKIFISDRKQITGIPFRSGFCCEAAAAAAGGGPFVTVTASQKGHGH